MNIEYEEEDPYNPGYYYYPDYLGYFFSGSGSQPIDWYYIASGIYNSRPDESIHLGDTHATIPGVYLDNVKVYEITGYFSGLSIYDRVASLNVGSSSHGVEICDGDDPQLFTITVNFTLPPRRGTRTVALQCKARTNP